MDFSLDLHLSFSIDPEDVLPDILHRLIADF